MTEITYTLDSKKFRKALRRAPDRLLQNLKNAVLRATIEVDRFGKRGAPKAHSTLAQSIRHVRTGVLEYVSRPTVDYAPMVASETGKQGTPPFINIYDWVRVRRLQARDGDMNQYQLAWVIAKAIKRKGTPENDFMGDAAKQGQNRLRELVDAAVDQALREVGVHA